MGACLSSLSSLTPALDPRYRPSDADKARHREAERQLRESKAARARQVKILLLGSGDSGKSTVIKQMRLIHKCPFKPDEIESYRQLVFNNLTMGMKSVLDAVYGLGLEPEPHLLPAVQLVDDARDLRDGEMFPREFEDALGGLWSDESVREAVRRGNEFAIPENLTYFYTSLPRLFDVSYLPTSQDILHTRSRTIGITETTFDLRDKQLVMVDVGGQKSERRKWIHCFEDVTGILFLVNLSGYDQCLVEEKGANQMQDAMLIWDSICHSQWFKQRTIILFLNKDDLFQSKVYRSDVVQYFPDYEGPPHDADAARDYFKRRFSRLARKAGRVREREVFIHVTTAVDTAMLRVVMTAVEDAIMRASLDQAALI